MPGDSHHFMGIPGYHKNPFLSQEKTISSKKTSSSRGAPCHAQAGQLHPGGENKAPHPNYPQQGVGSPIPEPTWPKWGSKAGLGWGALGSSVVKFGKDDPQLISENTVFLGLLPGAL